MNDPLADALQRRYLMQNGRPVMGGGGGVMRRPLNKSRAEYSFETAWRNIEAITLWSPARKEMAQNRLNLHWAQNPNAPQ